MYCILNQTIKAIVHTGKTSTVYVKVKRLERLKAGLFLASCGLLLSGEMGRFHALAICWRTCRGEGRQLMFFAMASQVSLFPCAVSSSTVSSSAVNFAGKGLPPSCVFKWCLIPCKPDFIPKLSLPSWHFNRYEEVFSVTKGMQGSKSLTFLWNWLLDCTVFSTDRQFGVGIFIESHSKACFFKELWMRTFSSPATWIYHHLRGTVRIILHQKLLVSWLIKWY